MTATGTEIAPVESKSITSIAEDIRTEHEACERDARSAVDHAIRCGELLVEAKAQIKHGEWLTWLEANFPSTPQTASGYMRLAATRGQIESASSIRGALAELATPRAAPEQVVVDADVERHEDAPEPSPEVSQQPPQGEWHRRRGSKACDRIDQVAGRLQVYSQVGREHLFAQLELALQSADREQRDIWIEQCSDGISLLSRMRTEVLKHQGADLEVEVSA